MPLSAFLNVTQWSLFLCCVILLAGCCLVAWLVPPTPIRAVVFQIGYLFAKNTLKTSLLLGNLREWTMLTKSDSVDRCVACVWPEAWAWRLISQWAEARQEVPLSSSCRRQFGSPTCCHSVWAGFHLCLRLRVWRLNSGPCMLMCLS